MERRPTVNTLNAVSHRVRVSPVCNQKKVHMWWKKAQNWTLFLIKHANKPWVAMNESKCGQVSYRKKWSGGSVHSEQIRNVQWLTQKTTTNKNNDLFAITAPHRRENISCSGVLLLRNGFQTISTSTDWTILFSAAPANTAKINVEGNKTQVWYVPLGPTRRDWPKRAPL